MILKEFTLHQLKVFEAVARHGNFTRAAEELSLTQPTVSMQVKQLTQAVGTPLLEQLGKRLYQTDAGEMIYSVCREIFGQLDQLEMKIAKLKGVKQGQLRLAAMSALKSFVPRLLGPFCQLYPGIDISLELTNRDRLLKRMTNFEDDLYIMSQPPMNPAVIYSLLIENPLVVAAPAQHPLAKLPFVPLARLSGETFVMREPGSGTRRAVQAVLDEHQVQVKVKVEMGSNEAVLEATAAGMGLSVLSYHMLREATARNLAILNVEAFPIQQPWYVVYPENCPLSPIATTFLEWLQEQAQNIAEPLPSRSSQRDIVLQIP